VDNLFEYFDESNSKFKRVVFQLLKCLKVFKKGFTKL
jgi:predicted RNA-binding protein (virulence factor B family)